MADPFAGLKQDHREVEQLFDQFDQSGDVAVARRIARELTIHATVEEELVYPMVATKVDQSLANEARAEHDEAKRLIKRIEAADEGDEELASVVGELRKSVEHHVAEEEAELFPRLGSTMGEQIERMDNGIAERKKQLNAQIEQDSDVGLPPTAATYKPTASGD
jgi:hemerythrin superfamily protein